MFTEGDSLNIQDINKTELLSKLIRTKFTKAALTEMKEDYFARYQVTRNKKFIVYFTTLSDLLQNMEG